MERRRVVTSFLMHEGKVLLLKRSERVGSMRGKWAGVSGYLEGDEDPYERALKEIREEVGLESYQLRLIKKGEPVEAPDMVRGDLVWMVHTFLFEVEEPSIRIDWEHDEYRWVEPKEVGGYETVPKLKEALSKLLEE